LSDSGGFIKIHRSWSLYCKKLKDRSLNLKKIVQLDNSILILISMAKKETVLKQGILEV
jgi:hypothetical protein